MSHIATYQRKPETVTAIQWWPGMKVDKVISHNLYGIVSEIDSIIEPGDWIVFHQEEVEVLNTLEFNNNYTPQETINGKDSYSHPS